jgi:two-component system sensor histidine kinase ChiS
MLESKQESYLSEAIDDELVFAEETDDELIFEDEFEPESQDDGSWKILIVDDETEIHQVTQLALNEFNFEGKSLKFLSAYSGEEAKEIIQANPDIVSVRLTE